MSIDLLERAAARLGPLTADVAFLGGASLGLWTDDPGAPEPRVTRDVDVVVVVDTSADYYRFAERLRDRGLCEDVVTNVICRWRDVDGVIIDVMPTDARVLGFSDRWYREAVTTAQSVWLPSGTEIRAVTPPLLLATKLEAFNSRGRGDYLASVDFEDVVRLVDGRALLGDEMAAASEDVRRFVVAEVERMLHDERFEAGVASALLPDAASQARIAIVLDRFRALTRP